MLKGLTQYPNRKLADLVGCSYSTVQTNINLNRDLSIPEQQKRLEEVYRYEELIRGNPADKILLVYEYEQLTGIDFVPDIADKKNSVYQRKNKNQPSQDLKSVSLQRLKDIQSNNYQSRSYENHTYEKDIIDNEIQRKELAKNKKEQRAKERSVNYFV